MPEEEKMKRFQGIKSLAHRVFCGCSAEGSQLSNSYQEGIKALMAWLTQKHKHSLWDDRSISMLAVSKDVSQTQKPVGECGFGIWKLSDLLLPRQKEKCLD